MRKRNARRLGIALSLVIACALSTGCFNPFRPLVSDQRGVSTPAPTPNSPRNVLELFKWCWENRAIEEYREVFTDDYAFQFAQLDTAGNAFRDRPWTREDEMISATNLFVGGSAQEPPADRITLDFTNTLREFPDSRPGKNSIYHREFRVEVSLRVTRGDSQLEVRGPGLFFVVRGDSAAIPEELVARGFLPDSNRWWIEGWWDETVADESGPLAARRALDESTGSQAVPVSVHWGSLKAAFRRLSAF